MKIEKINQQVCKMIAEEAMEALQRVAAKYELIVKKEAGKYTDACFTFKATFSAPDAAQDKAKSDWELLAESYGCKKDWYGQTFTNNGKILTITGLNLKARKDFVMLVDEDFNSYKSNPQFVAQCLAKKEK